MHSLEIDYLVMQEQYKDCSPNVEQEQSAQADGLQQEFDSKSYQNVTGWFGKQMVKWGSKLQGYDTPSPSETCILKT